MIRRADTDLNGALDQQRFMCYDASWRLCEEQIWDDWSAGCPGSIDRNIHYTWGPRYIDDIAFRRVDNNGNEDYSDAGDDIYYHLTDAQFSTKVVIDSTAAVVEWVEYTPYGVAGHHHKYDMDNDRDFDSSDRNIISALAGVNQFPVDPTDIDEAGYRAEADINRDGTIDTDDYSIVNGASDATAISAGLISTGDIDNIIGYDGYRFDQEILQYAVRFRVYSPRLGRWLERDPVDYFAGPSLYGFAGTAPSRNGDPLGLFPIPWGMPCLMCSEPRPDEGPWLLGYYMGCPDSTGSYEECVKCAKEQYRIDMEMCKTDYPKPAPGMLGEVERCGREHAVGSQAWTDCIAAASRALDERERYWRIDRTGCENHAKEVLDQEIARAHGFIPTGDGIQLIGRVLGAMK